MTTNPELIETELDEPTKAALRQIEREFVEAIARGVSHADAWNERIKAIMALLGEESEE